MAPSLPPGMSFEGLNPVLPDSATSQTVSVTQGQAGVTAKQRFTRETLQYDNPFLDMTSTFIPARYKDVLRILAAFVLNNGIVNQTIIRMAEYPITDLIYGDDNKSKLKNDKTEEFWKDVLEERLKIRDTCRQAGIDRHAYGNSFVSINFPFKRMLTCSCGKSFDAVAGNARYVGYKFEAICPKCKTKGTMVAKDVPSKELDKLRIVHWDILQIDIKYNTITGEHFYYYTPDKELRRQVSRGDMDIINNLRLEVLDAIRTNKKLKLNPQNLFHYKRIGAQYVYPQERGWGISAVMPALKDLFHAQVLKKGNEMIAFDHINPLRVLYPTAVGEVSPHSMVNLQDWRGRLEDEIMKWRTDHNHISIMPIPVGLDSMFGDAKLLMVHQELRFVEDNVITSLGVIPELIRGGATWSGSSVSLRVIENSFLNYRGDMQRMIDWVIKMLSHYFGREKISVTWSDFKMADDIQQKQLIVNAANGTASQSMLSQTTVIKELGFDPEVEYNNKNKELLKQAELLLKEQKATAEAMGAAAVINAVFGADANIEGQNRMNTQQMKMQQDQDAAREQQAQENAQKVLEDAKRIDPVNGEQINIGKLIMVITDRFAKLHDSDATEFASRMLAMKNSTPAMYEEVYKNLKEMNVIEADTAPNIQAAQMYTPGSLPVTEQGGVTADAPSDPAEQMNPGDITESNPEQKPPTREGGSPM